MEFPSSIQHPRSPSEIIVLLNKEFICNRPQTLISLNKFDKHGSYPTVALRTNVHNGQVKCLGDFKDLIRSILTEDNKAVNSRDYSGLTPLHLICSLHSPGQMKILKLLCDQKNSCINALDSLSRTPLHHCLSPSNLEYHSGCADGGKSLLEIVTFLIERGANLNALDFKGVTPLHLALDYHKSGGGNKLWELPEVVTTLLNAGADPEILAPHGLSGLHLACRLCFSPSLKLINLLISPTNINDVDEQLRTPLHEAIASVPDQTCVSCKSHNLQTCDFFIEKVVLLLENGADVDATDADEMTPILMAIKLFKRPVCAPLLKRLLEKKSKANVVDNVTRTTPLHSACEIITRQFQEFITIFLEAGGSLNAPDSNSITPFHCCLKNAKCSVDKLTFLIENGADPLLLDSRWNNSIHMVCQGSTVYFKEVVSFLVEKGCDINNRNKQGNTPLLLLLLHNHHNKDKIETLINLGADCNDVNFERISALHMVSRSLVFFEDIHEIVEVIIKAGARVNVKDWELNTPLHYAVRDEATMNIKAIRKLLLAGADPNVRNSLGMTPLHIVCSSGSYYVAKLLLYFGAQVNAFDADGNTPLHVVQCALENADPTVQVLINHGADLSARNNKGVTPFQSMGKSTYYFMIGYIVLLIIARNHHLNPKETFVLESNKIFLKRYEDCFSCAQAVKGQYLGGSSVTLMDFLLATDTRAARYVRNPKILNELGVLASSAKYRWYRSMINCKLERITFINELIERSITSLRVALSPVPLPDWLFEKILGYLDVYDMNALNCAVVKLRN